MDPPNNRTLDDSSLKRKRGSNSETGIYANEHPNRPPYSRAFPNIDIASSHRLQSRKTYNPAERPERTSAVTAHHAGYLYASEQNSASRAACHAGLFGPGSHNTEINAAFNGPITNSTGAVPQTVQMEQGSPGMWDQWPPCPSLHNGGAINGLVFPYDAQNQHQRDGVFSPKSRSLHIHAGLNGKADGASSAIYHAYGPANGQNVDPYSHFLHTQAGLGDQANGVLGATGHTYGPINGQSEASHTVSNYTESSKIGHLPLSPCPQPSQESLQSPPIGSEHIDLGVQVPFWGDIDAITELGYTDAINLLEPQLQDNFGIPDNFAVTRNQDAVLARPMFGQQVEYHLPIPNPVSHDWLADTATPPMGDQTHRCHGPWSHIVPLFFDVDLDRAFDLSETECYDMMPPTQATVSDSSFDSTRVRVNSPQHSPVRSNKSHPQRKSTNPTMKPDRWVWADSIPYRIPTSGRVEQISGARRNHGNRKGPLPVEAAKKAANIRKIGSCWRCWLSKVPCSPEEICNRCKPLHQSSMSIRRLCNRQRLCDYTELFFPPLLVSHLEGGAVKNYITENVHTFTNTRAIIRIASGPTYPKMVLSVHMFQPKRHDFLALQHIEKSGDNQKHQLSPSYAPPFGLDGYDSHNLRGKCLAHIEAIVEMQRDHDEVQFGEMSEISWQTLDAVYRYRLSIKKTRRSQLLCKALMLYAMHYFMSRVIMLADSSASVVRSALPSPTPAYNFSLTPRLLHRQVKHEMQALLRSTTREVLEVLEWELRTRKKSFWPTTFCVILILCLCTEAVQVATDAFVVYAKVREGQGSETRRETAIRIARDLDDRPYSELTDLFHDVYRSHKSTRKRKSENAFNPIRDGLQIDDENGIGEEEVKLVEEIRQLKITYGNELEKRAGERSLYNGTADLLADHMMFRAKNSGRLASKFILSFYNGKKGLGTGQDH